MKTAPTPVERMKRKTVQVNWPAGARIIEFNPRNGTLARELLGAGFQYLGVSETKRQAERLQRGNPSLETHVVACREPKRIRQNNAEVLILNGGLAARIRCFRDIRHASFVVSPARNGPVLLWAMLFWLGQFLLGRLALPRLVQVGQMRLIEFRVRRPKSSSATRQFIPHRLGIEGFFRLLCESNLRHVVLRWFESLPQVPAGEDLDLLVGDESLSAVRMIFGSGPGLQAVDLYSVCGAPGADYQKLPYYPPYLAEELLDHSVMYHDLCHVPSPRDYFLSLAYHALYHKGLASGLQSRDRSKSANRHPEHDYPAILRRMAQRHGISLADTLEDFDAFLDAQGWRPPHDMLVRLARKNTWLHTLLKHDSADDVDAGLAVFLVRHGALARGGVQRAVKLVVQHGFEILETIPIDPQRIETVANSIRGGNWGPGPWPMSGGPPVAAIVVYDAAPIRPTRRQQRRFPFLANARLLKKEAIRDAFNSNRAASEHCNVIHSSDNGREARDYLRVVAPERAAAIVARIQPSSRHTSRAA